MPDSALTAAGFKDESTGAAYDPAGYAAHTGGVFFVGVEGTGTVHGFVLQDSGSFTKVASISTGLAGVMEVQWEPQTSRLWVVCDDTCNGQHRTLKVNASGVFATTAVFNRPTGMPNLNNEGFAIAGCRRVRGRQQARLLVRRQQHRGPHPPQGHRHLLIPAPPRAAAPGRRPGAAAAGGAGAHTGSAEAARERSRFRAVMSRV